MTTTMTTRPATALLAFLAAAAAAAVAPVAAQEPGRMVTRPITRQYEAGALHRFLLGDNWRDAWGTPVEAEILDLRTFAGGLEVVHQGGGNQSITLHMDDPQGRRWIFRSLNKDLEQGMPPELRGTAGGKVVQDLISALHPGSHFALPRLLDAVGVLHAAPDRVYVMPDDPALGEFRETFAGMMGQIEQRQNEGPDDTPGFAGSTKIKASTEFLKDLEDSAEHRLDEDEFLRARLVDLLVGDPDRGTDQWRWARFGEEGAYVYRPVPRDRDWAFVRADGFVVPLARGGFPKLTRFERDFASVPAYTFSSHFLDRQLLTRLTRADFTAAAAAVQAAITDAVIDEAVADLPPAWAELNGAHLASVLRDRRDDLAGMAQEIYAWLASDVDVRGTDERDLARIERHGDGSVLVTVWSGEDAVAAASDGRASPDPFYQRLFVPGETGEVRIYLQGNDDVAEVTGSGNGGVLVRVIGGGGDDVLSDATGAARLYDHRGSNEFVQVRGTRVDTRDWVDPPAPEGIRVGWEWAPDWGRSSGLGPAADYREGGGVALGISHSWTDYGFRHLPYEWRTRVRALFAPGSGDFGADIAARYNRENSRMGLELDASATAYDGFRFYGFGNASPDVGSAASLVMRDRVWVHPALTWSIGARPGRGELTIEAEAGGGTDEEEEEQSERPFEIQQARVLKGQVSVGPILGWTDPKPAPDGPLAAAGPPGSGSFGQLGARAAFTLARTDQDAAPRRGFRLQAHATAYPAVWDATGAFGDASVEGQAYIPLIGESHMALRAGGERVFGEFPVFEAAFLGGRESLRGFQWQRFAGDMVASGSVELRVPVDTVEVLVNGELGVFGLADAGRVWMDGASPGGWHTAFGGGLWFATLGQSVSVAYAHGEGSRFYAWFGLPF